MPLMRGKTDNAGEDDNPDKNQDGVFVRFPEGAWKFRDCGASVQKQYNYQCPYTCGRDDSRAMSLPDHEVHDLYLKLRWDKDTQNDTQWKLLVPIVITGKENLQAELPLAESLAMRTTLVNHEKFGRECKAKSSV